MIRLQLLGTVEITDSAGGSVPSVVTQPRRLALLAYLAAAEPHGFHRRDKLLGLLWPEYDEERARAALRKALHFLRQQLGPVIVNRGDQEIGIDPERLQCDARELLQKLDEGDLENALPLYQGDLLDGFFISEAPAFHSWLEEAREQLRRRAIRAALTLAEQRARRRQSSAAKEWSGWASSRAPYDEGVLRRRLAVLAVLGDRAGALRIYQEFADRLLSDLEVEPSPETRSYVEQLRHGRGEKVAEGAAGTDETPTAVAPAKPGAPADGSSRPSSGRPALRFGLAAVAVTALVAGTWVIATGRQGRTAAPVPEPQQVTFSGDVLEATLSADGRFAAYVSQRGDQHVLSVLEIGVGPPLDIWSVDPLLLAPQWSPDGARLVARTMDGTYMLPRLGGAAPQPMNTRNITAWTPDGSRLYSWWPQAQRLRITDVVTNDTVSVPLPSDHEWVDGVHWDPTYERVAFISHNEPAPFSLYVMSANGSDLELVHRDWSIIFSPQWSPEANAVYYMRLGPSDELWKVPVTSAGTAAGPATRLLSGLSVAVRNHALPAFAISADGRRLLYARRSGYANVWSFQPGESSVAPRQLTTGTSLRRTPRLSPSGRAVAFIDSVAGRSSLFVMPMDDGPTQQLTSTGEFAQHPVWSPDGQHILYGAVRQGEVSIRTVTVAGGTRQDVRVAEPNKGAWMAWGEGAGIMYQHADDRNYGVVDPVTGRERRLLADTLGWLYEPRPSHDGRLLAVWLNRGGGAASGLWIVDIAGGSAFELRERLVPVGWAADDATVFAMREIDRRQGGSREILAVRLADGEVRPFYTLPSATEPWNVDVAPDGSMIVAALGEVQADAWMIENFDPDRPD